MTDKYTKRTQGFTLVELSIVIIIIGFLIAGISAGQSLVRQASLNAVINDFTKFKTAINAFESRYSAVAGDFKNGYSFWATVGNCTDADVNTGAHDGCNGNGDGNLGGAGYYEGNLMWKHLSLAGLINGSYSGTISGSGEWVIGVDVPAGPLPNSGYYSVYDNYWGFVSLQDMISFSSRVPNRDPYEAILKPADAKNIDIKLDDGLPSNGKLVSGTSYANANGLCSNGTLNENLTGATEYILDNDQIACRMIYFYTNAQ